MSFMDFLFKYYFLIIFILIILVIGVIGFIVDAKQNDKNSGHVTGEIPK